MFEVSGIFKMGERYQTFKLQVNAKNEKLAVEYAISRLGSNHKCKRRFIKIQEVKRVK